jgi:DNA polymerase III epsilon subunit-like protein
MTRIACLDIESSGLDPDRHEAYEVGLILVEHDGSGWQPDREWRWWLPISLGGADPAALRVGRYYERLPEQVATYRQPWLWSAQAPDGKISVVQDVAATLARLLDGAHVYGMNPAFDLGFLAPFLRRYGQCPTWHHTAHDVRDLAAGFLAASAEAGRTPAVTADLWQPPIDTAAVARALEVDPDRFDKHTALGDARLVRALLKAVTGY